MIILSIKQLLQLLKWLIQQHFNILRYFSSFCQKRFLALAEYYYYFSTLCPCFYFYFISLFVFQLYCPVLNQLMQFPFYYPVLKTSWSNFMKIKVQRIKYHGTPRTYKNCNQWQKMAYIIVQKKSLTEISFPGIDTQPQDSGSNK